MNFTKCPFHLRTAVSCHFGWAKGANKRANVQTKRHGRGGGRSDPSVRGRLAEPRRGASPGAPRGCQGQGQNCGLVPGRGAAELRAHRVRFGFAVSSETHRSNATPLASASCSEPGRGAKSRGDGPRPPACRLSKTPFPQDRFAGVKSAPPPPPSKARASRVFPHCLPSSNVSAWTDLPCESHTGSGVRTGYEPALSPPAPRDFLSSPGAHLSLFSMLSNLEHRKGTRSRDSGPELRRTRSMSTAPPRPAPPTPTHSAIWVARCGEGAVVCSGLGRQR